MRDLRVLGTGAFGPEPSRDDELASLVRDVVGGTPHHAVDWTSLATRIADRIGAQSSGSWWSYAARWERRMIPLALAAGIIASAALLAPGSVAATTNAATSASALATAVASGAPAEDAASAFVHAITNTSEFTAGVPE